MRTGSAIEKPRMAYLHVTRMVTTGIKDATPEQFSMTAYSKQSYN